MERGTLLYKILEVILYIVSGYVLHWCKIKLSPQSLNVTIDPKDLDPENSLYIDNQNPRQVSLYDFELIIYKKGHFFFKRDRSVRWKDIKSGYIKGEYQLCYKDTSQPIDEVIYIQSGHVYHLTLQTGVLSSSKLYYKIMRDVKQGVACKLKFRFRANVRRTLFCVPRNRYVYTINVPVESYKPPAKEGSL